MNLIKTIYEHELYPDREEVDVAGFKVRRAARAIVFDGPKVALLHATKYGYYKLPGGGIEEGEDIKVALAREALEEIGCQIEITGEVGEVVEYRAIWKLKQISYCFVADKVGQAVAPDFTEDEQEAGFEIVWAPNLGDAIKLVKESKLDDYEAPFIIKRDASLLEAAKKLHQQLS